MTPKEKAKYLVDRFYTFIDFDEVYQGSKKSSKQCALICVDEILKGMSNQINQIDTIDTIYWLKVKQEINKL